MRSLYKNAGFTLLEALIAMLLTGVITTAILKFYATEHNHLLVQQSVSDMQQNVRSSLDEIAASAVNAGAFLPNGMQAIQSTNTNPDTLTIQYVIEGGNVRVGDHTQKQQASPIHVEKGSDLSQFTVGQTVYLWYEAQNTGEWFTVTKISTNNGSGWEQIYHKGQVLMYDPAPGDRILALEQMRFFVDNSDTTHPVLMRQRNGGTPEIYADNIYQFDIQFYLTTNDTVTTLTPNDTARILSVVVSAQSNETDIVQTDLNRDGRRRRTLSSEIYLRNSM